MIKYVELTAPESSEFRQVKILSMEVSEGDSVRVGDPLFIVQNGKNKVELPSTKEGRVIEIIALVGENISLMTPLVLLETEVEGSTATPPIVDEQELSTPVSSKNNEALTQPEPEPAENNAAEKPVAKQKNTKKKTKKKAKKKPAETTAKTNKNSNKKEHQQQSLDLGGDAEPKSSTYDANLLSSSDKSTENPEIHDHATDSTVSESKENKPASNTMKTSIVTIPDIGSDSAKVIDILVKVGDTISVEDPLITLESDKASMDVPSPYSGIIESISVELDQDIAEGTEVLVITNSDASAPETDSTQPIAESKVESPIESASQNITEPSSPSTVNVTVPDIGGDPAKVIEILVKVGQEVQQEDSLITLESDKASMEVPSPSAGVISSIDVQLDDEVNEGHLIVTLESSSSSQSVAKPATDEVDSAEASTASTTTKTVAPTSAATADATTSNAGKAHASPSIRRFARELGVDLTRVAGSGRKGRITRVDVNGFVKSVLSGTAGTSSTQSTGSGIPEVPAVDFTKFGEIDIQPLNRIKQLTATFLHRSWLNIPHVTHADESNITELEAFRKQLNAEYLAQDKKIKLSPLAFIVKAVVNGLQTFPQFNSSLEPGGKNLIYKKYVHIGIAVETPNGLVVPVIRDADKKTVADIAVEMGELAKKARDNKLTPADMSGACFTISSLGGIGGTHFTPIVNSPEVAILGVSRSKMAPVWNGEEFIPAMMLPLSLSYDHRVIDGAEAARFTRHLAAILEDVRRLTV
jgi:pyruvate dehydrogenase E2 component (dihydrolipoamide acetyltransferase)